MSLLSSCCPVFRALLDLMICRLLLESEDFLSLARRTRSRSEAGASMRAPPASMRRPHQCERPPPQCGRRINASAPRINAGVASTSCCLLACVGVLDMEAKFAVLSGESRETDSTVRKRGKRYVIKVQTQLDPLSRYGTRAGQSRSHDPQG